jgi:plasmid stabilization system protein ParE
VSAARVEFTLEALREIDDAFEWYFERSVQAAEAFIGEATSAFALIASAPAIWPNFEAGTRRYVLRKFPYSIIYREIQDGIEVIAVAHHKGGRDIGGDACLRSVVIERQKGLYRYFALVQCSQSDGLHICGARGFGGTCLIGSVW